jgi:hypothetical protein
MQVRCNFYGLMNASTGVECLINRDLLEVGENFQYKAQDYIIVSVVESQGRWFANVVPEHQWRFVRRPVLPARAKELAQDNLDTWRSRAVRAEEKVQAIQEEQLNIEDRLDRLMHMLDHLTKDLNGVQ